MHKTVHCYAEGRNGAWEAICLDFDLSVQGDSFEQVYQDLNKSIEMYREYIGTLPEDEQPAFINRKAPLSLRLRFLWHALRGIFDGDDDSHKSRHDYTTPCMA